MSMNYGSPQFQPDGTTIVVSAGALTLGTIPNNAVKAAMIDQTQTKVWQLLNTLQITAASTGTTPALTAFNKYMLEIEVTVPSTTAAELYGLRFNGDVGNNYTTHYLVTALDTQTDGSTSVGYLFSTAAGTQRIFCTVFLEGITQAQASGQLSWNSGLAGDPVAGNRLGLHGFWVGGNATQISTITFLNGGAHNMTATVKVYGSN
jgi:hypothetical protein